VIDLHSHILPGVDDGPADVAGSLEIARACVAGGVAKVAATPHVRDDYPTDPGLMEERVALVNDAVRREGIDLDVLPGGEIAIPWLDRLPTAELRRFGLGGNPRYLLVEFPYYGWAPDLPGWIDRLRRDGITPVLAHPERNPEVQKEPERVTELTDRGALVQVTAESLDGRVGRPARVTGLQLIDAGLAHVVASDAHHASIRAAGLARAVGALGDEALARWLTDGVPRSIVEDDALPERPASSGRPRPGR
jgi:protein-tyrosine phosphatase